MATSIKARLTFLYVGILALILAGFSATLHTTAGRELSDDLDDRLDQQSRAFADQFFRQLADVLRGTLPDLAPPLREHLRLLEASAVVYDAGGREIFRSEELPAGSLAPELLKAGRAPGTLAAGPKGRPYRFTSLRATEPGGQEYWIAYGLDETPVHARLGRLRRSFAIFIPLVLVVSSLAGWIFVRRALAPVETLRRQAERISRSSLSERVPLPGTSGELRELAATFNEMLDRLERSFEQVQTFASNASHELKTPLANLRGEVELALRHPPADTAGLLASIAEEVARMTRVVENMLLLARLDAKEEALERAEIDLSTLAADSAEEARAMGESRNVSVKSSWIAPGVRVVGDEGALRRVVMNLLENGVKYNREGGEVRLSVWSEGGTARIEVADDGPGIPADHVPHLFERFHRVRANRVPGTGLGLSICRMLVEAHGGRIEVSSREGVGTSFRVELPARPSPAPVEIVR